VRRTAARLALWGVYGCVLAVGIPAHILARCADVAALLINDALTPRRHGGGET